MDLLRYIPCFTSMKVISGDLAEWFWLAMQALQQSWFRSQCPQTIASIRPSCAHPLSPVLEHSSTRTESPYLGTGQVLTLTFFLFRYPDWQDAGQSNIQKVRHSSVRMQHSSEGYTVATVSLHRLMVNGSFLAFWQSRRGLLTTPKWSMHLWICAFVHVLVMHGNCLTVRN
jgi:hypothetical protein